MKLNFIYCTERTAGGWLPALVALLFSVSVHAAGIQDLAPTAADAPVMLETGRPGFNNFADFNGVPEGRLYVSFGQLGEILYLGLAPEYNRNGEPFISANSARYRFQIRRETEDGTNPVVHGPFEINQGNANVNSYGEAAFGTYLTTAVDNNGDSIFVFRPQAAGDYFIEFDEVGNDGDQRVNIPFWDFTVVRSGAPVEGRVWSRGWAFRTPEENGTVPPECVWDREFNGTLFSYTEDGFVSKIDFNDSGFQGLSFSIAFNTTGPGTSGDLAEDRKSVPGRNATDNARQHRIFTSLPDQEIFPDGVCGEVDVSNTFLCDGAAPYCLNVDVTRPGQVEILLDFNGNGILDDNSQDVNLVYSFTEDELSACVPWDGLRGDSTPVNFTDTVDVLVTYAQGVQHYSAYDVEFLKNGFCVETVRPVCNQTLTSRTLYYDDRDIPEEPGTGVPKDRRDGCECSDNCRTWDNFSLNAGGTCNNFNDALTTGYGDKSTLNTYWFANSSAAFQARVPVVNTTILGDTDICAGEETVLTGVDQGIVADEEYLWSGPGVDGATTESVTVTQAGTYCVTISSTVTGCSNTSCREVTVTAFDQSQFPADLSICFGESVRVPVAGNPAYTYQWAPTTGIDDPTSNQPTFSPESTTVYTVTISNANADGSFCTTVDTVTVNVVPDINLRVFGGGPICDQTTTITAVTDTDADVVLFAPDGTQLGTGNDFTVVVSGTTDYLLIATNTSGCTDSVTFTVQGGPVNITVPDSVLTCLSDGVELAVTNLDDNDQLTYAWEPADLFDPATVNTANPLFVGAPGDYTVTVTVTNQFDCSETNDVELIVIDDSGVLAFSTNVECDGSTVTFTNNSTVDFGFVYDFGDGTTSTDANPVHVYDQPGTYTVTLDLIYDQDCIASVSQEVTTLPSILTADFGIDLDGCDNGSAALTFTDATFNATGDALSYDWSFTGLAANSSSETNPTVAITESGEVTVSLTVTTDEGCTSTTDSTFTVDLAVVSLADEIVICPGASTELNPGANPDLTYTWSPAPDFDPNVANPTTSVPGTYVVTVTATAATLNCTNTDTVRVVVPDDIDLVVNGPDGPIGDGNGGGAGGGDIVLPSLATCGDPVDLTVDLSVGNDNVTITYTDLDGNPLGMGGTLTVSPDGRDTIVVTAENEFGCIERDTVVIINNQVDASIDVVGGGFSICSTRDTSVAVVNNDPADTLTYQWEDNEIITGPLDGPTVDISAPDEGSVDLSVLVSNQFGCDTTITITVQSVVFTPNNYPDVVTPCFAESITIPGGAAVAGYEYDWVPSDNLDLSDPANPVGTFEEDQILTVTITDPTTGCSETQTVAVDVAPEIGLAATPVDTSVCEPTDITVTANTMLAGAEIVWYADADYTNQIGAGPTFVIEATDLGETYTIYGEATDPATGCTERITSTVQVFEFMPNDFVDSVTPCFGESVVIEGGTAVEGYVYEWTPSDNLDLSDPANPVGTFEEDVTLTVVITDPASGCSDEQTVEVDVAPEIGLTANPADTTICEPADITVSAGTQLADVDVVWYSDADYTNQIGTGPTFVIEATDLGETYTIYGEATDPATGCTERISSTVQVLEFTPNDFVDAVSPCFGESVVIEGGPAVPGYVYEWVPATNLDLTDPANPVGTFEEDVTLSVTITDPQSGCSETQTVVVDVSDQIALMASPTDTTVCTPGDIVVRTTTMLATTEIVWYDDPDYTNQIGTGSTFTVAAAEVGVTYVIYGEGTDPATGCTERVVSSITVSNISTGLPSDSQTACGGDPPSIFEPGVFNPDLIYTYDPENLLDLTDPNNPIFIGTEDALVTVSAIDPVTGCTAIREIDFTFVDFGGLTGEANPPEIFLGESSELTVLGDCEDCTYEWFGENGTIEPSNGQTVTVTPDAEGDLVYEVLVSRNGCTQTVFIELRVQDPLCDADRVFVPNAFTPNGDGNNDVMRVRSKFADQITEFRFIIYDRWGQEVYASDDIDESWNGVTEGDDLEPDVYGYWLRVVCPTGQELIQQGNITLLR